MSLDGCVWREIAHCAKKFSCSGLSIIQPDSPRALCIEFAIVVRRAFVPECATLRCLCIVQASIHAGLRDCASGAREIRLGVYTSFDGIASWCLVPFHRDRIAGKATARASFAAKN